MKVLVLGAGIIGITSAWFLRKEGHEVTVIDRQTGAGQETSFANGGQISVSHAKPWANPRTPMKVCQWLGHENAPLLYRFRCDPFQWKWALYFLRECLPARTRYNIHQIVTLCEYSRRTLAQLRAQMDITYDGLQRGILHFYTNKKEFALSRRVVALMRDLGCPLETVTAEEVVCIEPALAACRDHIVGGDFDRDDESGDAHQFTVGLAQKSAQAGVHFHYSTTVTGLIAHSHHNTLTGVEIISPDGHYHVLTADSIVVALGSFSRDLLLPLRISLMIYPGKGYSATYPIIQPDVAPMVSLIDNEHNFVISRFNNRLRIAGTCELGGEGRALNPIRCNALTQRAKILFPDVCNYDHPVYWAGLRPLTPSNIPYIGQTPFQNLFVNTGHGTLGWTMGCGAGRAIADIVSGRQPEVAFPFMGLSKKFTESPVQSFSC